MSGARRGAGTGLGPEALPPLDALPGVSYIMPILNEAGHVEEAVSTILAQDYPGQKEIVVALGPSTDGTTEIVRRMAAADPRIITVDNPAGDTPIGLNLAVAQTTHPVVIRVDAHSELTADYTARGVAVLRKTRAANAGGLMRARGRTAFQRAVARAYMSRIGSNTWSLSASTRSDDVLLIEELKNSSENTPMTRNDTKLSGLLFPVMMKPNTVP